MIYKNEDVKDDMMTCRRIQNNTLIHTRKWYGRKKVVGKRTENCHVITAMSVSGGRHGSHSCVCVGLCVCAPEREGERGMEGEREEEREGEGGGGDNYGHKIDPR